MIIDPATPITSSTVEPITPRRAMLAGVAGITAGALLNRGVNAGPLNPPTMRRPHAVCAGALLMALSCGWSNAEPTITVIQSPPGASPFIFDAGLSLDGTTVIGSTTFPDPFREALLRWTAGTGFQVLETLARPGNAAAGVSPDGSIVVGSFRVPGAYPNPNAPDGFLPYRWSSNGDLDFLPSLAPCTSTPCQFGAASGVSADGSVIVGRSSISSTTEETRATRWVNGVPQNLGSATIGGILSEATGVSPDGSVIVGIVRNIVTFSHTNVFRWTQADGMVIIGPIGTGPSAFPRAVSADGAVIVGGIQMTPSDQIQPFRWTASNGFEVFDMTGFAVAVNHDGATIAVRGLNTPPQIWRSQSGLIPLSEMLLNFGADLTGIEFSSIGGMSSDGNIILASGTHDPSTGATPALFHIRLSDGDADGDGIPDDWEINGVPYVDADGVEQRYMLPGADPQRKDIYIEIDFGAVGMPPQAVSRVVQAFANAPVTNPDGSTGITLHVMVDEVGLPFGAVDSTTLSFPFEFPTHRAAHFGTPEERMPSTDDPTVTARLEAKAKVFRYAIVYPEVNFIDPGSPWRGLADDIPGNNLVLNAASAGLAPGAFREFDAWAGLFMHEFGHLLGLRHGGGDDIHGKPNYASVMNYALTAPKPWSRRFWRLDYSREQLATLDENALIQRDGITSTKTRSYSMPFGKGPQNNRSYGLVRLIGKPTDFTGDGNRFGVVSQDLTFIGPGAGIAGVASPTPGDTLKGHDDWASVQYLPPPLSSLRGIDAVQGCPTEQTFAFLTENVPEPCDADLDGDGVVDFKDLMEVLTSFGAIGDPGDPGDINMDGVIDSEDLDEVLARFGQPCP